RLGDLAFTAIDTAGLEQAARATLSARMQAQTAAAIAMADAVFFVIDARTGPMPADRGFADLVRRSGKPATVGANKREGRVAGATAADACARGLGDRVALGAERGEGLADLCGARRDAWPEQPASPGAGKRRGKARVADARGAPASPRLAIIG